MLREYSGLSRVEFGRLFSSKESTVCTWEYGGSIPRLAKLICISAYFGVSLDGILNGKAANNSMLEQLLCRSEKPRLTKPDCSQAYYAGRIIGQFNDLTDRHKERLIGYLEALIRENALIEDGQ